MLIVVQNLPVPLDRRVWLECQALRSEGYEVSVICPKGPGDPARQEIDGIQVYKYRPAPQAQGLAGYALEFAYAWMRTAWLSVVVGRRRPFQVLQACNPPDTYWALGLLWRRRGVTFVFDHHDLNPELFLSRFGDPDSWIGRLEYGGLRWLERCTFKVAQHVITTNDSYKRVAIERGGLPEERVTVVRSAPDTERMRPVYPAPELRRGKQHLLVYLGIMGPQDGVETVLDVMDELVRVRGRTDVRAALLGFGDCLAGLRARCHELGLDDVVEFTGRVGPEEISRYLSAADVGLGPDPKTPLNDVSTMNKTMEYMAFALPSVAFDLAETRVTGQDGVLYAPSDDVGSFADAIERLLDDAVLREEMGLRARRRVAAELDWRTQRLAYLATMDAMVGRTRSADEALSAQRTPSAGGLVDLEDERELRRFIRERSQPALRLVQESSPEPLVPQVALGR